MTAEGSWAAAEGFGFRMQYTVHFEKATAEFEFGRKEGGPLHVYADGKSQPIEVPKRDGYVGELAYFIECVKSGNKPTRVTAEDAVVGLQIVEAEKRSIETGRPADVGETPGRQRHERRDAEARNARDVKELKGSF